MDEVRKLPKVKLASIRSAVFVGLVFGSVWFTRILSGQTDYSPILYLGHLIDMPSVPRFLDAIFVMPLGGLVGASLATLKRLPDPDRRDHDENSLASRIKTSILLAAITGFTAVILHLVGSDEPAYTLSPGIGLLLLLLALIACIPKNSHLILCGSAGMLGLSFATYYGGLAGLLMTATLVVIYEICLAVGFLFRKTVELSSRLFSWTCGF